MEHRRFCSTLLLLAVFNSALVVGHSVGIAPIDVDKTRAFSGFRGSSILRLLEKEQKHEKKVEAEDEPSGEEAEEANEEEKEEEDEVKQELDEEENGEDGEVESVEAEGNPGASAESVNNANDEGNGQEIEEAKEDPLEDELSENDNENADPDEEDQEESAAEEEKSEGLDKDSTSHVKENAEPDDEDEGEPSVEEEEEGDENLYEELNDNDSEGGQSEGGQDENSANGSVEAETNEPPPSSVSMKKKNETTEEEENKEEPKEDEGGEDRTIDKGKTGKGEDYQPPNDEDPLQIEDEMIAQEVEAELQHEEKVARRAGGLGVFLAIGAMIFTAYQMSENPDGIFASVCRLAITICGVVFKIIFMPCRKLLGAGHPHYNGHMPISTVDYSYRGDPYRGNANAGFELS